MHHPDFPAVLPGHLAFAAHRAGRAAPGSAPAPAPASASDDELVALLSFTPVPRRRQRRDGWTPDRQRGFIAALALCGSVSAAARSVGVAVRGAYRLVEAPGSEGFARAWDAAVAMGFERTRCDALDRALNGGWVPVYRKGRLVRVELRRSDRLAIALLAGRSRHPPHPEQRQDRAAHRADQREFDAAPPERQAAVRAAIVARIVATCAAREAGKKSAQSLTLVTLAPNPLSPPPRPG